MAFMHIHRAKDDTLNSCIRLTFEINLVSRVLYYSSLRSERETETLVGSGHVAPEQNYFCETLSSEGHCTPLLSVNFLSF